MYPESAEEYQQMMSDNAYADVEAQAEQDRIDYEKRLETKANLYAASLNESVWRNPSLQDIKNAFIAGLNAK